MSLGFNIKPGWANTVYADAARWQRLLDLLDAGLVRFPWVNNAATIAAMQWCADHDVEVMIEDPSPTYPAAQMVSEIASTGLPVAAIEGINEPNLYLSGDWQTTVAQRQRDLYSAVGGRWPVACPPISTGNPKLEPAMFALPCDILAVHRYAPYSQVPPNAIDFALPDDDRPVWVTETGYTTKKKWVIWPIKWVWACTYAQQAQWLPDAITLLRGNGATRIVVYEVMDSGTDQFKSEANYGAFDHAGNPKPVAAILAGL